MLFKLAQYLLTVLVFLPLMLLVYRIPPAAPMLLFPVFVALQALFTIGVALILATSTAFFRDVRHLVEVALMVLFWTTPIVYTIHDVSGRLPQSDPAQPAVVVRHRLPQHLLRPAVAALEIWAIAITYTAVALDRRRCGSSCATKTASRSGSEWPGARLPAPLETLPAAAQPGRRAQGPPARAVRSVAAPARRGVLGAARRCRSRSTRARPSAMVGRNGSGKSTFLKLVAGIHSPTSGDLLIAERQRGSAA